MVPEGMTVVTPTGVKNVNDSLIPSGEFQSGRRQFDSFDIGLGATANLDALTAGDFEIWLTDSAKIWNPISGQIETTAGKTTGDKIWVLLFHGLSGIVCVEEAVVTKTIQTSIQTYDITSQTAGDRIVINGFHIEGIDPA